MKKLTSTLIQACIAVLAVVAASSCQNIVPITVDTPAWKTVAPGSKIACSGAGWSRWDDEANGAAKAAMKYISIFGCYTPVASTTHCDYSLEFTTERQNEEPIFSTCLYSYGKPDGDAFSGADMRAYYRHERSKSALVQLLMSDITKEEFLKSDLRIIQMFSKKNVDAWGKEGLHIIYPHRVTQKIFSVSPFAGSDVKVAAESCKAGNWDKGEQQALAAVAANPKSGEAYNLLGIIALQKRQFDKAEECFKQADRVDPSAKYVEGLKRAMDIRTLSERAYADLRRMGLSQIPF